MNADVLRVIAVAFRTLAVGLFLAGMIGALIVIFTGRDLRDARNTAVTNWWLMGAIAAAAISFAHRAAP